MPISSSNPFKWRHYPGEVIITCVRWYLRFPLAYEHVAELIKERGLAIDASCIWRWVQAYGPELEKSCRPHLKPTSKSYRVDETCIRIRGEYRYLFGAVDKEGQTTDFLLTARRDTRAAKRFFHKALSDPGNPQPRVINVDKNLGLSGRGRGPQSGGHIAPSLSAAPVQVFEQHGRARSEGRETARLAGQGLRVVSDGVEDSARDRGGQYDTEGESTMGGQG